MLEVAGDPLMEQIVSSDEPVVVETTFLEKPCDPAQLLRLVRLVRQVLDSAPAVQD